MVARSNPHYLPSPPPTYHQVRLVGASSVSGAAPGHGGPSARLPLAVYGVQDVHELRLGRRRGQDDLLRLLRQRVSCDAYVWVKRPTE